MIIGIDVREGARGRRAGKGEYVYQLVQNIIQNDGHQFILFSDKETPKEWKRSNVKVVINELSPAWWQLWMVWQLNTSKKMDVYFSPTSLIVPALVFKTPIVMAVMDFVSFIFPEHHNKKAVLLEKIWMKKALNNSRHIISISENTKKDAIRLFNIPEHKITTVYLAASVGLIDRKLNWVYSKPIILHIGTLEPRKNLDRLVQAFSSIKKSQPTASLVLVGRWGWQSEVLKQTILGHEFGKDIHVIDDLNNTYTAEIYKQANVFVFPSLYEGFGLPPLEAMSFGVPVVASNSSSIPEVVGNAAILVNPNNANDIAQATIRVLKNDQLRLDLIQEGFKQSQKFSWEKTAKETLKILENA